MHLEGVCDHRLAANLVPHVDHVVALIGADPPEAQEPGPRAQLLLDQLAAKDQLATRDEKISSQLLAHPVHVDLVGLAHARREFHPPFRGHQALHSGQRPAPVVALGVRGSRAASVSTTTPSRVPSSPSSEPNTPSSRNPAALAARSIGPLSASVSSTIRFRPPASNSQCAASVRARRARPRLRAPGATQIPSDALA